MTTKHNKPQRKHKNIIMVLIIVAVLFAVGAFAYTKANDVMAETLVTKIAAIDNSDSGTISDSSKTVAANIYKKMSTKDQAKVKQMVSSHITVANVKKVTEYLGNNDVAGLKEFAYDNLSDSEIAQLKDLYEKYK